MTRPIFRLLAVVGGRAIVNLSTIAIGILTARILGASARGTLAVVQSTLNTAAPLLCFSLVQSNPYWAAKEPESLATLAGNSLLVIAGWGLTFFAFLTAQQLQGQSDRVTAFALLWLWGMLVQQLASSLTLGLGWFSWSNRIDIVVQSGLLIGLLFLHTSKTLTLPAIILGRSLACLLSGGCQFAGILVHSRVPRANWSSFVRAGSYGTRVYVGGILVQCLWSFNQLPLSAAQGPVVGGYFAVAAQAAAVTQLIPAALCSVLFPQFVGLASTAPRITKMRRLLPLASVSIALNCLVAAIGVKYLLVPVLGAQYRSSVELFYWMLPGIWCFSIQQLLSILLSCSEVPLSYLFVLTLSVLFQAGVTWHLAQAFSAIGAAWAFSLTGGLLLAATLVFLRSFLQQQIVRESQVLAS